MKKILLVLVVFPLLFNFIQAASPKKNTKLIVYYFHSTIRCETCIKIEKFAEQCLKENFQKELADGKIEWKILNIDDAKNAKLVKKYDLMNQALIVSKVKKGKEIKWKSLEDIWKLYGQYPKFSEYVKNEIVLFNK